jgi:two-component system sensor histidine kinase RegB
MLSQVLPKSEISIRENLKWLVVLRNMIILAAIFLMFIVTYGLGIKLPIDQLWLVIFAIAAVNLYTWMRLKTQESVTELEIFSQLSIDVLAMASMLYLTGGASNPIIWVFLLPVIVTGIMLPQTYTWNMVILTACTYTILIGFNIPLPAIEPHMPDPALMSEETLHQLHMIRDRHNFNLHIFGMWFGFVFSAGLVAFFVIELSQSLKDRERNLAEAREQALRNEKVVSLGTLAASSAHEMGTPLGTIAILTHELKQEFPEHRFPDLHNKLKIMDQQLSRCKEALSLMSASAGKMRAESGNILPVSEYIDEILNLWRADNAETTLRLFIDSNNDLDARIIAEKTQTHAIINILNNASQVTPHDKGIEFHACWTREKLHITVRDFGPGIPDDYLRLLGNRPVKSKKSGMGVGLLLTCSTINRLGGSITFENMDDSGANVEINLPLIRQTTENQLNDDG